MSGSKTTYKVEDVYTQSMSAGDCEEPQPKCEESGWDSNKVGIWICAIILIILFTIGIVWGVSCWNEGNRKRGKGKHGRGGGRNGECGDEGFGSGGAIGAFLVWLIIVIIFVICVCYAGWLAIIVFLILFIIIGLIGFGWSSWNRDGENCREEC